MGAAQGNSIEPRAYLVVMAGGSGTRFWPKSTSRKPKQLLSFDGGKSLLQQTLARFDGLVQADRRMIVTTELLKNAIAAQAGPTVQVLAEPQGRNTAPCVYWAAREIHSKDPNAIMLVMPSDHMIPRITDFSTTVREAIQRAQKKDELITLGISPTRPETGYGYLRTGEALGGNCKKVSAFVEKPGIEKAREFLSAGNYLWNGGMFVWSVSSILSAFDQLMPEMKREWSAAQENVTLAYPKLTATSIDYGIMEKASNVVTFPLDCGWDDLGSWTSVENIADQLGATHPAGVVVSKDCVSIDSHGNIIDAQGKMVALLGVENTIVVETDTALLIARKDRAQDIKAIVDLLKKQRPELV